MNPRRTYRGVARHPCHIIPSLRPLTTVLVCFVLAFSAVLSTSALDSGPAPGGPFAAEMEAGASAPPTTPASQPEASSPPLPTDCTSLAPPGGDPPASCVYGYVLLDGSPVAGASVTVTSESGILNLTTQTGPESPDPYYAAALSDPPLFVSAGELVDVQATHSGQTNATTFTTVEAGQQVDVWLSSTCGPTSVSGGLLDTDTTWTRACGPYIVTGNLLVLSGVTLTVEAGTAVKFDAGRALQVDGRLDAQGMPNAMIVFTSSGSGAAGDWGYILLRNPTSQPDHNLTYVLVEYGGGASVSNNAALRVDGTGPVLHDITVRHSASDGVRFYNGATGAISRATVYANAGWGIYAKSASLSAANSALHVHNNTSGGLYIIGVGVLSGVVYVEDSIIRDNDGPGIDAYQVYLYVSDSLIRGNRASNGAGIKVLYTDLSLSDSWLNGNVASAGGGSIYCGENALCLLHHNVISNNSSASYGGGVCIQSAKTHEIQHNIFSGNAAHNGGGLAGLSGGTAGWEVRNNAFLDNTATAAGAAIFVTKGIAITENTILHNTAGLGRGGIYAKNNPVFNFNNLYGNSDYDFYNDTPQGAADLNAEQNWWGTTDSAQIADAVLDWFDDPSLGFVDFDPWLASHNLAAPISPPTDRTALSSGTAITLTWSPNPESDLAGYKVYYDTDEPGYPYHGTGANEGDSPIDVGNVLNFTLTGLLPGAYYLSVTAYDVDADGARDQTDGNESWFAPEVTAQVGVEPEADFSALPTSGVAPLTVDFTNHSTGDYDTCAWTFGDGDTSDACLDPSHVYTFAGVYTVTLGVSGLGDTDILTRPNYITAYTPVSADFSALPTSGVAPLTVDFANHSTGDYDTCAWTFGDGDTSDVCADPSHVYTSAGVYTVTLGVSGLGGTDILTRPRYISVHHKVYLPLVLRH